ncbi:hypothetical protein [uncultured Desulfobacter sp.]|uniref:hypothetical protein n=1 Tax=uncultured Desulfobacter sp. TaxID=240139 RepID=UPI002AAB4B45|nr:hypothetical protein [uncultured Desulfobacter sp.]
MFLSKIKPVFVWGWLFTVVFILSGVSVFASDTESFEVAAVGKSQEEAVANAVLDMLEEALEAVVGDEVGDDVGELFFEAYGRNSEELKKRYFTSDFVVVECEDTVGGKRCLIEAEIKMAKVDRDVRKIFDEKKKGSKKDLTFVAQTGIPDTPRNKKLLIQIRKTFMKYGNKFEYVDQYSELSGFAMNIQKVDFVGFRYNKSTKRQEGGLDVTFELLHIDPEKAGERLIASDVVTVSTYVPGTNPDILERELETLLIEEAANSFVRQVNSNIARFYGE